MNNPKISIVTVSYNAASTIERTILSVLEQKYENKEYIIIDGGSTDGTVDIIKKYSDRLAYWVSEPDKGIYDAMNKGIDKATGDYLQFLNSGDWLASDNVLGNVFSEVLNNTADVVYGDVLYRCDDGDYLFKPQCLDLFKVDMPIAHPGTFVKVETLSKYKFDLSFRISSDFHQLRRLYLDGKRFVYKPITITSFDSVTGVSSSSHSTITIYQERAKILGKDKSLLWPTFLYCFIFIFYIKEFIKCILFRLSPNLYRKFKKSKPNCFTKVS